MRAYYFLPGTGIYGGIKVGFQLLGTLRALGVRAVAVTPDGRAPQWFAASVPVLAEDEARSRVGRDDVVFFSLPHDHRRLAALPGRLVFHCQGTDPLIDPVVADPDVALLSCWPQATAYMRARGRDDVSEIGLAIADAFFYGGRAKYEGTIAHMPRRGREIVAACRRRVPHGRFVAIDGLGERAVAARMQRAGLPQRRSTSGSACRRSRRWRRAVSSCRCPCSAAWRTSRTARTAASRARTSSPTYSPRSSLRRAAPREQGSARRRGRRPAPTASAWSATVFRAWLRADAAWRSA